MLRRYVVAGGLSAVLTATAVTLSAASPASAEPGCPTEPSRTFTVPLPAGPPSLYPATPGGDTTVAAIGSDSKAYDTIENLNHAPGQLVDIGDMRCLGGVASDQASWVLNGEKSQYFVLGGGGVVFYKDELPDFTWPTTWKKVPGSSAGGGVDAIVTGNRTDIFYRSSASSKNVIHHWQIGGTWFGPENLGGATNDPPSVTRGADGAMHVWLTGTNNTVYVNAFTNRWSGWRRIVSGKSTRGPAATFGYDGTNRTEDVFVVGTDGNLYQGRFTNLSMITKWTRIVDGLGTDARISAAAGTRFMLVYMGLGTGETLGFRYVGGWDGPFLPPYLCDTCTPEEAPQAPTAAGTKGEGVAARPHVSSSLTPR